MAQQRYRFGSPTNIDPRRLFFYQKVTGHTGGGSAYRCTRPGQADAKSRRSREPRPDQYRAKAWPNHTISGSRSGIRPEAQHSGPTWHNMEQVKVATTLGTRMKWGKWRRLDHGETNVWRRGWDSNPRYGRTVNQISSLAHSTTLPPLLVRVFVKGGILLHSGALPR
jgi:hypothetical protein